MDGRRQIHMGDPRLGTILFHASDGACSFRVGMGMNEFFNWREWSGHNARLAQARRKKPTPIPQQVAQNTLQGETT